MATLIVEQAGQRKLFPVNDRLLIGRSEKSHVRIDEPGVPAVQAQVRKQEDACFLEVASDGVPTLVNGQASHGRRPLVGGDEIRIGGVRMVFREEAFRTAKPAAAAVSHAEDARPAPSRPAPKLPAERSDRTVAFRCRCGAVLRARASMAGQRGKCAKCGKKIRIPAASASDRPGSDAHAEKGPSAPSGAAIEAICSICQTPVEGGGPTLKCPSCALSYHVECWKENMGCATYGCAHVDCLMPKQSTPAAVGDPLAAPPQRAARRAEENDMPLDAILLASATVAALLSAFMCGFPSLVVAVASIVYAARARQPKTMVMVIVWVLSVPAMILGGILSLLLLFSG